MRNTGRGATARRVSKATDSSALSSRGWRPEASQSPCKPADPAEIGRGSRSAAKYGRKTAEPPASGPLSREP